MATVLNLAGVALVIAGVYLAVGIAAALIVGGGVLLLAGYVAQVDADRAPVADPGEVA